jgi:UDP-3-O-[3-hydroxymyristoyl] glucosamine N-acyltransferase
LEYPGFFERVGPFALQEAADQVGAALVRDEDSLRIIDDVRTLRVAGSTHLTFFKNPKYASQLAATGAGGCILTATSANRAPETAAILTSSAPYSAFAHAVRMFYPESMRTKAAACAAEASGKLVHPTARISEGVVIEPGAVVGPHVAIGAGTTIAAGALVGFRV